jgi:alkylhydroperoxidase family enzyme
MHRLAFCTVLLAWGTIVPRAMADDPRTTAASDESVWKQLPERVGEQAGRLPNWAKVFAGPLPRTTAAMLELDWLQRTKSTLDPKLRVKVRWAAARANRCAYSEQTALADLRRAGGSNDETKNLTDSLEKLSDRERLAIRFATNLTKRGSSITDKEFEQVRNEFGDPNTVAIVLGVAYANFQDRLILSYGIPLEAGGPLPPLEVQFKSPYAGNTGAPRVLPKNAPADGPPAHINDPDWLQIEPAALRAAMESQKASKPRVPVPTFEEIKAKSPPNTFPPGRTLKINWSLVCMGYQPELAAAWIKCLRTFEAESKQDRIFEECLFWVVTRSIDCFY